MMEAVGEPERLAALRGYGVLDTPNEPEFDAIVRDAARLLDAPTALISLLADHRQWFKARVGLDVKQLPRSMSFCTHAIRSAEVMTVPDAAADPRFADNPLVRGGPAFRFYAGAPLKSATGWNIGMLCVLDKQPHPELTADQTGELEALAARTMTLFEARRARRAAREKALAA